MKIDKFKQKSEEPKTYHELKQEEEKEQPARQSSSKPQFGSVEYELRGIGWNVKEINSKLTRLGGDLEYTLQTMNSLLDAIVSQQKETNRLLIELLNMSEPHRMS